jgi:hypothetical protein
MGPRSPEGKAAKAVIAALDKAELDEAAIAYMLYNSSRIIHKRLWKIFMHLVKFWASDFDNDDLDPESLNVVVNAKRVHEQMERFGQMFD